MLAAVAPGLDRAANHVPQHVLAGAAEEQAKDEGLDVPGVDVLRVQEQPQAPAGLPPGVGDAPGVDGLDVVHDLLAREAGAEGLDEARVGQRLHPLAAGGRMRRDGGARDQAVRLVGEPDGEALPGRPGRGLEAALGPRGVGDVGGPREAPAGRVHAGKHGGDGVGGREVGRGRGGAGAGLRGSGGSHLGTNERRVTETVKNQQTKASMWELEFR